MSDKTTAAERVAQYERAMFRSAAPTVDGALVGAPTRAVSRKDAIRIAEEHADAAVVEVTRERDDARHRARTACQTLGEALVSVGPENIEQRAVRAVAALTEMKRERDEARAALKLALDGVHCACIVFEAADGGEVRS